jgi:hypothetical protein
MNTQGKMGDGWKIFGVVAFLIVLGIVLLAVFGTDGTTQTQIQGDGVTDSGEVFNCPSDLGWSGTITVQNNLNTTGAETFDTTMYFYDEEGKFVSSITDTTSGSVTLTCGKAYMAKILSVDAAAGDSGRIISASGSGVDNPRVEGGVLKFTALGDSGSLTVKSPQHGLPQIRVYDVENDGYLYAAGRNSATEWNTTDPANFTSVTDNTTQTAVGSGGSFHIKIEVQTQNADELFNDLGVYLLIDENTNNWSVPAVKVDGSTLTNIKSSLPGPEAVAYSDYEYIYKVEQGKDFVNPDKIILDVASAAKAGVDPGLEAAPNMELAAIGTYTSVDDANILKIGAVDDTTSNSQVYALRNIDFKSS